MATRFLSCIRNQSGCLTSIPAGSIYTNSFKLLVCTAALMLAGTVPVQPIAQAESAAAGRMKENNRYGISQSGQFRTHAFAYPAAFSGLPNLPAWMPDPKAHNAIQANASSKRIAIVIDDFGNAMTGTSEMLKLPFPITAAVMPFMPTTRSDAETAHKLGHDVIVHMPMEPNKGKKAWLGPGAITTDLSDEEIRKRVEAAIDNVPHAVGMNNHMGSKVTANERVMRIVLAVCKERGLFFLDSKTTYKTVIPKIAAELNVPLLSNHVFLDDVYSFAHISKQIGILRKHLEQHEDCVAIGHVGPPGRKTAAVLLQSSTSLRENAVIVKLSELVRGPSDEQILP